MIRAGALPWWRMRFDSWRGALHKRPAKWRKPQEIQGDTSLIVARIEDLARSVEQGLTSVESVGAQLDLIRDQSDRVQQQVARIAEIDQANEQSLEQVFSVIESVRDHIAESDSSVASLAGQAATLMELAENANAAFALNSSQSYHRSLFDQARAGAAQIGELLSRPFSRAN